MNFKKNIFFSFQNDEMEKFYPAPKTAIFSGVFYFNNFHRFHKNRLLR